ncbi:MAG: hypothetical protein E6J82_17320 [Deltaproteobacteria bacterium]|nr:MAG: hypothetical protein E6J82_17320 [Deltaproteobacteria bacterium]
MRLVAVSLAFSLLAAPAFARRSPSKGPRAGGYCSKSAVGTTSTDKKGVTLECKADGRGRARWTRK